MTFWSLARVKSHAALHLSWLLLLSRWIPLLTSFLAFLLNSLLPVVLLLLHSLLVVPGSSVSKFEVLVLIALLLDDVLVSVHSLEVNPLLKSVGLIFLVWVSFVHLSEGSLEVSSWLYLLFDFFHFFDDGFFNFCNEWLNRFLWSNSCSRWIFQLRAEGRNVILITFLLILGTTTLLNLVLAADKPLNDSGQACQLILQCIDLLLFTANWLSKRASCLLCYLLCELTILLRQGLLLDLAFHLLGCDNLAVGVLVSLRGDYDDVFILSVGLGNILAVVMALVLIIVFLLVIFLKKLIIVLELLLVFEFLAARNVSLVERNVIVFFLEWIIFLRYRWSFRVKPVTDFDVLDFL